MAKKKEKRQILAKVKQRKHLNADALFKSVYSTFSSILDHRKGNTEISLADALMSGFAMFSLKDPSLLAFDRRRNDDHNLKRIYGMDKIPSDSQMREILDWVNPQMIRASYRTVFWQLQRGKELEQMVFMEDSYLLALDGTGSFSSEKIKSESCLIKTDTKSGKVTYYQQVLGAAIVHPDFKEVIPLAPEMIIKQDGKTKNDCERNAAKRFFEKFRKEHPHLKIIVTEDALNPNAPHIIDLKKYGLHFILGVKPGDHAFLFNYVNEADKKGEVIEFEQIDENNSKIIHRYRFLNNVPINKSNQDIIVNFLEYWEISKGKIKHFCWVTDFTVTRYNAYEIMKGGRTRWRIENETFNTLKNQGYNLGHNYGIGKKYLSEVFVTLMILAFLVDQVQQLCCPLFRSAWEKLGSKKSLWEKMRALFHNFELVSMKMLLEALLYGIKSVPPPILYDTS